MKRLLFFPLAVILAAGCSDALEETSSAGQVIAFATGPTLELVAPSRSVVTTVALEGPVGFFRNVAGRNNVLLATLGGGMTYSTLNVVDLAQGSGTVVDTVTHTAGISGVAIQDDSIAWVSLYSPAGVARINYRTHASQTRSLSGSPAAVVITAGKVFVINSNDAGGVGPTWISVVDTATTMIVDSIPLTGERAVSATVGGDSLLYVIAAGSPGQADGKLCIVDPVGNRELAVINGLGDGAVTAVFHPSGRLLVASVTDGILEVNALTRSLIRGPGSGVQPGGHPVVSLALDNGGRVYAGDVASCGSPPGIVHVLAPPPDYEERFAVTVDGCPQAAATAVSP